MQINELSERVTIQQKEETTDSVVDLTPNYIDFDTVWAKVEYVSTKEIYTAKANNTLDLVKFIIRYRNDIKPNMRINFNGDCYEVKGNPRPLDKRKIYLLIVGELVEHE